MKRLVYILTILSTLSIVSCEIETSNNGKLDGNWQLRQIDTITTGGSTDMSQSYIYWSVENNLLQVRDIDNNNLKILFRFEKQGDSLTLRDPHFVVTKDELVPLENDSLLQPLGIYGVQEGFQIQQLSNTRMTLQNHLLKLHFRKY